MLKTTRSDWQPWQHGRTPEKCRRNWCTVHWQIWMVVQRTEKHIIVFASDNESETEETSTHEQSCPEKELVKQESVSKASGKLFDSSDDEESDSKEDSTRFSIKPQFEGRAGQKLMDLQSHFGSDERFRMDSRFLESDSEDEEKELNENTVDEDELAAERKKTLSVVQSVLSEHQCKQPYQQRISGC